MNGSKGILSATEIITLYKFGLSCIEIGIKNNTAGSTVRKILLENNIKFRLPGQRLDRPGNNTKHGLVTAARKIGISPQRYTHYLAINKLGGKCIKCGITDIRILQFNHLHTKNIEDIETEKRDIIAGITNNNIEVRCANCNILYEYEIGRIRELPCIL